MDSLVSWDHLVQEWLQQEQALVLRRAVQPLEVQLWEAQPLKVQFFEVQLWEVLGWLVELI